MKSNESRDGPGNADYHDLVSSVDPAKERRIIAHVGAPQRDGWTAAKYAIFIGLLGAVAIFCYKHGLFGDTTASTVPKPPPAALETPAVTAGAAVQNPDSILKENDVQTAVRSGGVDAPPPAKSTLIPPPPADNEEAKTAEEDSTGIIGNSVKMGAFNVEVENYWADAEPGKEPVYAVLTGYIQNAANKPMALPVIEVALLDNEKRLYKPAKSGNANAPKLNPLMKAKNAWFFQLPPDTPMYCAQFSLKEGKNLSVAYVRLGERTAENLKLMNSPDYEADFVGTMLEASPRVKAQEEYYRAKTSLDSIGDEKDGYEKQIAKLARKVKAATDSLESAKANASKAKEDTESAKAFMKDLDNNQSRTIRDQTMQAVQYKKAEAQFNHCAKAEQAAADALKEKTAAKGKIDKEMLDLQSKLKLISTKYDIQQKVVDKVKEKLVN